MANILYIGNKNYSSWSLRPWLCLRWAGIEFTEQLIRLDQPGYGKGRIAEVLAISPTGRVPCLHANGLVVWDTLAIAEWAAEERPQAGLWPAERALRATARSVTAEMHSGFAAIRRDLAMNIHRRCPAQNWAEDTRADLERIERLWTGLREQHGACGAWLFGKRSIADAFYLPVAARLRTYGVKLGPVAQQYCDFLLTDPDFRAWETDSIPDSWDASGYSVIDRMYT
jgi:glutathione S-transferase